MDCWIDGGGDGDDDGDDDGDADDDDDDDEDETTTATMIMMTTTRNICSLHLYEVCPDSWAKSAERIQPMSPFL